VALALVDFPQVLKLCPSRLGAPVALCSGAAWRCVAGTATR